MTKIYGVCNIEPGEMGGNLNFKTTGQRHNESQKAVIIDMMKSVGEIASKMWPVV